MLLIALAVAPGVAVCLFIYSLQRLGKESMRYLVTSFVLGAAATLPARKYRFLAKYEATTFSLPGGIYL